MKFFKEDLIDMNKEAKKWKMFVLSLVINDEIQDVIDKEHNGLIEIFRNMDNIKLYQNLEGVSNESLLKNLAFFIDNASRYGTSKHSLINSIKWAVHLLEKPDEKNDEYLAHIHNEIKRKNEISLRFE